MAIFKRKGKEKKINNEKKNRAMFPVFALLSPGPQLPEEGPVWSCRMCYFILFIKTKNIFCVFDMDGQAYATEIASLGTQEEGGWWVRWNRLNV